MRYISKPEQAYVYANSKTVFSFFSNQFILRLKWTNFKYLVQLQFKKCILIALVKTESKSMQSIQKCYLLKYSFIVLLPFQGVIPSAYIENVNVYTVRVSKMQKWFYAFNIYLLVGFQNNYVGISNIAFQYCYLVGFL